jgi:heme/copper-type cytochrome/quinol oxidase subunit 3
VTTLPAPAIDVAELPTTVFGHRSPMWWGTLGFMVIEGSTLVICVVAYFYLRRNFPSYPPPDNFPPALPAATVGVLLMLLSNLPMLLADRAARHLDLVRLRRWMIVVSVLAVGMCVVRGIVFTGLHVRWDDNAYGSAIWFILGFHSTIMALEVLETVIFTALLFRDPVEEAMYSAASDNAAYWYFMVLAWLPLYAVVFLLPRLAAW